MYLVHCNKRGFSVDPCAVAGVVATPDSAATPLCAAAKWVLGKNARAACNRRHTIQRLSQKHHFERNAVSTFLVEDARSIGRWNSSLRLCALTTGMILAMALGGVTATARSLDGRGMVADMGAPPILLASASSSTFDIGRSPTVAYPPEWFSAVPQLGLAPTELAIPTLVVWHGAPRAPDTGPSLTGIAILMLASTLAAGACMLFGRTPARRRR